MVEAIKDEGEPPRDAVRGKPKGYRTPKMWERAYRDNTRRTELHSRKPAEREGFIYIIQDATGRLKVGMTDSVIHRHVALNGIVPHRCRPLRLVRAIRFDRSFLGGLEKFTHWMLRDYALGGEWFSCSPRKAGLALNAAASALASGDVKHWRIAAKKIGGVFHSNHPRRGLKGTPGPFIQWPKAPATMEAYEAIWRRRGLDNDQARRGAIIAKFGAAPSMSWLRQNLGSPTKAETE